MNVYQHEKALRFGEVTWGHETTLQIYNMLSQCQPQGQVYFEVMKYTLDCVLSKFSL